MTIQYCVISPPEFLLLLQQLIKAPEEYANAKGQSHVHVALRMNASGLYGRLKHGDIIPFIVCQVLHSIQAIVVKRSLLIIRPNLCSQDGTSNPAAQRGYHPEELKSNSSLTIGALSRHASCFLIALCINDMMDRMLINLSVLAGYYRH